MSNNYSPIQTRNLRFIPVGGLFHCGGRQYKCIKRPEMLSFRDACCGCWFSVNNKACPKQHECGRFGRPDGTNVWFVEVEPER